MQNEVPTTLYQKVKTMSVLSLLGVIFQVKDSSYLFTFYKAMQDNWWFPLQTYSRDGRASH